jgi:putative ABC transport system permease protein
VPNQLLCKLPVKTSAYENTVSKGLMKIGAVSSVAFTTNLRSNFQKMIGALRYVVLVLILSAAALAFVVLFSLTSINIDERNRELATIKVLGFFNGELASYIYRENIVLTVISSIIGLGLGIIMERYVILTAEVDLVMFSRDILWTTYVYSAGLTLAFAAFVNLIMLRRFKKIDMVSSLKSVE